MSGSGSATGAGSVAAARSATGSAGVSMTVVAPVDASTGASATCVGPVVGVGSFVGSAAPFGSVVLICRTPPAPSGRPFVAQTSNGAPGGALGVPYPPGTVAAPASQRVPERRGTALTVRLDVPADGDCRHAGHPRRHGSVWAGGIVVHPDVGGCAAACFVCQSVDEHQSLNRSAATRRSRARSRSRLSRHGDGDRDEVRRGDECARRLPRRPAARAPDADRRRRRDRRLGRRRRGRLSTSDLPLLPVPKQRGRRLDSSGVGLALATVTP